MSRIMSTDEFWDAMGDPLFIRVDMYRGELRGEKLYTSNPPENTHGFILEKIYKKSFLDFCKHEKE